MIGSQITDFSCFTVILGMCQWEVAELASACDIVGKWHCLAYFIKDMISRSSHEESAQGTVCILRVCGFSEAVRRIFSPLGVVMALKPVRTSWNILCHFKGPVSHMQRPGVHVQGTMQGMWHMLCERNVKEKGCKIERTQDANCQTSAIQPLHRITGTRIESRTNWQSGQCLTSACDNRWVIRKSFESWPLLQCS